MYLQSPSRVLCLVISDQHFTVLDDGFRNTWASESELDTSRHKSRKLQYEYETIDFLYIVRFWIQSNELDRNRYWIDYPTWPRSMVCTLGSYSQVRSHSVVSFSRRNLTHNCAQYNRFSRLHWVFTRHENFGDVTHNASNVTCRREHNVQGYRL